jgi:hypothetical protein
MKRIFTLLIVAMSFFSELLSQSGTEPYSGVFINEQTKLTLSVEKLADATFQGTLSVLNEKYPWSGGFRLLGVLNASYEYNGNMVPFSLSFYEGAFTLSTEGMDLAMEKISDDPHHKVIVNETAPTPNASENAPPAVGARYKESSGAYSFQTPAGWTVVQEENGNFSLTSTESSIRVTIASHNYSSREAVKNDFQPLNSPENNTKISSSVQDYGASGLYVRIEGIDEGMPTKIELIALVSSYGGGTYIFCSGNPSDFNPTQSDALKTIANSMQFSKPVVTPVVLQWTTKLKGKQLLYLYSASGYSEKTTYDLCSNGSFVAAGDNSFVSGGASAVTADGGSGSWKIISNGSTPILLLTYQGGGTAQFTLSERQAGNEIGMNGKRFFVQTGQACQ